MSSPAPVYRSRRRPRARTPVTLLLLLALLVGATWYGARQLSAPRQNSAGQLCTVRPIRTDRPGAAVSLRGLRVNVYNAGSPSGSADRTAAILRRRGLRVLDVRNDPQGSTFGGTILLRAADPRLPQVVLLRATLRATRFVRVERATPVVDVVLGKAYRALPPPGRGKVAVRRGQVAFPRGC